MTVVTVNRVVTVVTVVMNPVQVSLLMRVGAQENPQARKTTVIGAIAAAGHNNCHQNCHFCLHCHH